MIPHQYSTTINFPQGPQPPQVILTQHIKVFLNKQATIDQFPSSLLSMWDNESISTTWEPDFIMSNLFSQFNSVKHGEPKQVNGSNFIIGSSGWVSSILENKFLMKSQ